MRSERRGPGAVTRAASLAGAAALAAALAASIAAGAAPPASADSGQDTAPHETVNRVHVPTTPQAYAGVKAVATPLRRMPRTRTAMSIALTPAHPSRNGKLLATGLVTQLTTRGWVHLAHAHVVLVYRPRGSAQWYWVLKGWTDTAGHYAFATRAFDDGTWAAYLDPDPAHLYSETRKVYLAVR